MGGTDSTRGAHRTNTRQRIQDVALALFAERGYEQTTLREIAEELDVTKAALYYHFKTKEDILVAIYDERTRPMDEVVAWAREQPATPETIREVLRRYSAALEHAGPLFRFMQENQGSLRRFPLAERYRERVAVLGHLLMPPPSAPMIDRVRATAALATLHAGVFMIAQHVGGDPEERRLAVLRVAEELVLASHPEATAPESPDPSADSPDPSADSPDPSAASPGSAPGRTPPPGHDDTAVSR